LGGKAKDGSGREEAEGEDYWTRGFDEEVHYLSEHGIMKERVEWGGG